MGSFVRNSVSTSTTLQLALRNGLDMTHKVYLFLLCYPDTHCLYLHQIKSIIRENYDASFPPLTKYGKFNYATHPRHRKKDCKYIRWHRELYASQAWTQMDQYDWTNAFLAGNLEVSHLFKNIRGISPRNMVTNQYIPDLIQAEHIFLLDADTMINIKL